MIDLGSSTSAAFIIARVKSKFSRLTAARRVARDPQLVPLDHADLIFEDALRSLGVRNEDDSIWQRIISSARTKIVAPASFREPHVNRWLSRSDTKKDLKVLAMMPRTGATEKGAAKTRLMATYMDASSEDESRAESMVQNVIAVIRHHMHSETRDPGTAAYVQTEFESLHRRFDSMELPPLVSSVCDASVPPFQSAVIDVAVVHRTFGEASRVLLGWPQDIDGHWIDRPQLNELYSKATQDQSKITVLLGRPGVGKSAILARLGARLREEGVTLLAIKADEMPVSCTSLAGIDEWIGCDGIATALRQLADARQVVVLIDQLDALADLMDQRSYRLTAVHQLVGAIRATPNIRIILSCREFEYRNDVRLSTLGTEAVTLEPPPWEAVEPVLRGCGVAVEQLGEEQRQVLRTPQHLNEYIRYFSKRDCQPVFSTYQALLGHVVREELMNVYGLRTVLAAEHIATVMASDEELWVARDRFEANYHKELRNLLQTGFLVDSADGLRIAFRHQTVFDFLRARAFLGNGRSLAEYVLAEKQESLFVRPILWSALTYLRESDRASYRRELGRLWGNGSLRLHLRLLLAAFLGQLPNPDDVEAGWLLPKLDDTVLGRRILVAMAGSPGWFERLKIRLPHLMSAGREQASNLTPLLGRALTFARDDVLSLVEKHWVGREEYRASLYWGVLHELKSWDRRTVEMAAQFVDEAAGGISDDNNQGLYVAKRIAEHEPAMAPVVLFSYLRAQTKRIAAVGRSNGNSTDRDIAALFGSGGDWYGASELASKAPKAFIAEGWSWLTETLEGIAEEASPRAVEYRHCHFWPHWSSTETLWNAFEAAIRSFSETEHSEFVKFVNENEQSDLMPVHELLALGLERVAPEYPQAVVDYLLGDSRRLGIGDVMNRHRSSRELISAVASSAATVDVRRLEKAILVWKYYRDLGKEPQSRFDRMKWIREDRVKLLRRIPFENLSSATQDFLRKEERAFPGLVEDDYSPNKVRTIDSPMSSEQMDNAADGHIHNLFRELTDDTEWDHPRRRMELIGGSGQASRAFAEFAEQCPDRALGIIERFQPDKQERPAGYALDALGDGEVSPEVLIACIVRLHARGFASTRFRRGAADCLSKVAARNSGLDESICGVLESWIAVPEPDNKGPRCDSSTDVDEHHKDAMQHSLLWDIGGIAMLPQGNYPILRALMLAYLYRDPMDADGCLGVLNRHIKRIESDDVWVAMTRYLPHLEGAHSRSTQDFLRRLFDFRPNVLYSQMAVRMLYRSLHWMPEAIIELAIDSWIRGSWSLGPQAAGEIVMVLRLRTPECPVAQKRVDRVLEESDYDASTLDGIRIGFAHTLRVAWTEPKMRSMATRLLIRLMSFRSEPISNAISWIFLGKDSLLPDVHTEQILRACIDNPHTLVAGHEESMIKQLRELLADGWNPRLVHAVATSYLGYRDQRRRHRGRAMFLDASLVELALTLHRLPDTRVEGLDLFEHLLASSSYDAEERLKTLDRRVP